MTMIRSRSETLADSSPTDPACHAAPTGVESRRSERAKTMGPRGEARRQAIEDAARATFLEKGYERATLAEILSQAGGSRSTFYEIYGGKDGLFRAVLEGLAERIGARLRAAMQEDGPLEDVLTRYGLLLLDAVLEPETQGILRILVVEGRLFPDIATDFFRVGPDATRAWLADYLAEQAARRGWTLPDPDIAARLFLGLVIADQALDPLICPTRLRPPAQRLAHVRAATTLFLRSFGGM